MFVMIGILSHADASSMIRPEVCVEVPADRIDFKEDGSLELDFKDDGLYEEAMRRAQQELDPQMRQNAVLNRVISTIGWKNMLNIIKMTMKLIPTIDSQS